MKLKRFHGVIAVGAIGVICLGLLLYRHSHLDPIPKRIPESSRQRVRENYAQYMQLPFVQISDASAFRERMQEAIESSIRNGVGQERARQVADFLAEVLLSKATGDLERYKRAVGVRARAADPGGVDWFYTKWIHRQVPTGKTPEDLAEEMFTFESNFRKGRNRLAACSLTPKGIRVVCCKRKAAEDPNTLGDLSEEELHYWLGPVANGLAPQFRPEVLLEEILADGTVVDWVDMLLVVKTRDDDAYPLRVRTWYHPQLDRWILESMAQQSSLRAAFGCPPLVY